VFHTEGEPEGLPHSEDTVELGVAHVDEALEDEVHSVEVALGADGEDEAIDHSPHCEEVELGVDPELDSVEDQVSVCVLGSLLTTPPSARLARARQKNIALTIVREHLIEMLKPVADSVASRGKHGFEGQRRTGKN
jgi:hypothetical protein